MDIDNLPDLDELSPEELELFESLLRDEGVELASADTIRPRQDRGELPLSFAQQRLWFFHQMDPASTVYNVPMAVRLRGRLDVRALAASLSEIVRRHESLRATFTAVAGEPVQEIAQAGPFPLPVFDLRALPGAEREEEVRRLAVLERQRPFELAAGPLLRGTLLALDAEEYVVLLTMHHIVSDGWSMGILVRELGALYGAFSQGRPSPLPDLPIQYADYAAWQRRKLAGETLAAELGYWRERLRSNPPVLELPADRPRPAVQTFRGGRQPVRVPAHLLGGVQEISRRHDATLFMTLLGVFAALLSRYSGQDDLVVGTPVAGRNHVQIEDLIGFFINTLVLRTDLAGDPSFLDLVDRVRETTLAAYAHQDLPFEKLVEELQPKRDLSRSPIFQVAFALQNVPSGMLKVPGLVLEGLPAESGTAKFDLTLALVETGAGLAGGLEYNRDLFDPSRVGRMAAHFAALVEGIVEAPERPVSSLPLLTEPESTQILLEWNDTDKPCPQAPLVHELFAAHARRRPAATAVAAADGSRLTYGELESRSNRLAWHLRALGVGPEVLVAICTERTLDRVVGIVGTLKAGGAYVSLDPAYPKERLTYLLEDAGAPVLLTEERFVPALPETRAQVILLDGEWDGDESTAPESGVGPDNLSYVVYTSGSTGKPKGVQIPHAGLMNLVRWHQDLYGVAPGERGTQIASPAFDASIWELWPYLAGGASLHIPDEETRLSSSGMIRWWAEQGITLAYLMTPLAEGVLEERIPEGLDLRVRALIIGGDRLHRRPRPEAGFRLMNHYGPAEYTVTSTVVQVPTEGQGSGIPAIPTIGRAVDNTRIYVLDRRQRPAPVGVPGELYVAGLGLARGYHERPDLTAEKFVPDPFASLWGEPGARMYRTADLVRWLPDGDLDFLGRLDHQVKIRGLRIELGEIESVLGQHPQVREAAVLVREDRPGDKRLTAYIVGSVSVEDLKAFLRERLPEYMVPAAFLLLPSLPLTSNGKVDRRALPAPEWAPEVSYTAPRTPVEEVLAGLFEAVLQTGRVGVEDDFFERGGHSLLATRLASRVRETFGLELPVRAVFEAPTVAGLAKAVAGAMRDDAVRLPAIERIPRDRPLPLSFAQQRLWFLDRLVGSSSLYNVGMAVRLVGPLDVAALSATLGEIVRRHETLRTHFETIDGEPVQVVSPTGTWSLPVVDLRGRPGAERQAEARRLAGVEARLPFDLSRGPLLRATLLELAPEEHVVLLTMHHIISDGWSKDVLVREVMALYRAFAAGRPSPLPELPVQYADFAGWQRRWLQGGPLERQTAYWKRQLTDLTVLDLPTDRPRPAVQTFAGANSGLLLARDLEALHALGRREGATLFMTLLAAFQALLHRITGQTDLALGTPIAGRNQVQTEGLIGFFINTLVLRGDASGDPTYSELVRRAREAALGAYAHQDLPFEKLVAELQTDRDRSRSPLFQVMFGVQNAAAEGIEIPGLRLEPLGVESGTSKFDLTLTLNESPRGLLGLTEHNSDLFDSTTMARMLRHLGILAGAAVADPGRRISELPLWTEDERQQVLTEWNDTAAAVPDALLHEVVAGWAARTSDAVALIFGGHFVTYDELDRRSNRLARHLQTLGIGHEVPVGLCVERSPELVVGLLGVLKAGGCYLPLDPGYPAERLEHMIGDAGLLVLLTQEHLADGLPNFWGFTVRLDSDWETVAGESDGPLALEVPAQGLAYVIYTSGSTGRAKGVMVSHAGIGNLTTAQARVFRVEAGSRVLQFASPSFDASISEIAVTLAAGATLCMADRETLLPGPALLGLLRDLGVTTVTLPPSALAVLPETDLPALHTLVVAGEACPVELARRWSRGRRFVNAYGPTEATVCVTSALFDPENGRLPLGRAIDNTLLFLLDRNLEPVPAGITGEVYAAGVGLARGYLNRPELTAAAFVPNPWGAAGERLYRTGDLGRLLPGGELEFLGRGDHQVKVRGFRIELGEIEAALAEHPSVREAVALAREDNPGEKRLVAYFVPNGEADPSQELRESLQAKLPDYMVPAFFVALDELPLLPNGKVNRRALPVPERKRTGVEKAYAAPRNRSEELLAAIWSEVLRQERVSVDDNFFELGGDSILGIQAIFRAGQAGLRLTPGQLFEHPTVARLAAVAEIAETAEGVEVDAGLVTGPVLLTPVQRWFFGQELADSNHYNQAVLLEIDGGADPGLLARAFGILLEHHDALRMRFAAPTAPGNEHAEWRQWNEGDVAAPFARIDLAALPEDRLSPAIEAAAARLQTSLSPTEGPLQRFALFMAGEGRPDRLLLIVHHLVMDGVSWRILLEDLGAAYRQLAQGEMPAPPPRTTSYQRWAERLAGHARSAEVEAQGAYWLERLARPAPRLPLDHQGGPNSVASAKSVLVSLDAEETRALLQEVPRAYRTQINDVLLAALAEAFGRWTGSRRLLFDLEGHGREDLFDDVDLSRTVGWFTALYPVLLDLEGVTAPGDVLKAAKEQLRAVPGRGIAYGLLRHLSDGEAGERLRRLPAAEVVFNYLGQFDQAAQEGGIFRAARESSGPARSPRQTRPYLFEINAGVRGGRLRMGWIYSEDLHLPSTVERLAELFLASLRRLIAHCQSPEAGGTTPSDFPLARLDQPALDRLMAAAGGGVEDLYPVSPVQEGMLFHTLLAPQSGVYVGQVSLTLNVDLDVKAFERAWEQVVLRHPILRTAFYWQDLARPLQVVYREVALPWERLDLRGLPAAEQKVRLAAFLREDRRQGFDPARPPLLGLALIRLDEQSYRFVWSHHHLVLDGWSIPILLRDLFALYSTAVRGEEPRLEPVRPYRDYIAWLERQDLAAAETFWRQELAGFASPTPVGSSATAPAEPGFRHEALPPARTEELRSFARGLQLTLNTVIQGAWALLLQRYSGNEDVVFGAVTSGRAADVPGIETIVGLFINTLPARAAVAGTAGLGPWLQQLQERQAAVRRYEFSPLSQVQGWSEVPRGLPLFDSILAFENYPVDDSVREQAGRSFRIGEAEATEQNNFLLTLVAMPGSRLGLRLMHDGRRVDAVTAERMVRQLCVLLEGMTAAGPERTLASLPLLTEAERHQLAAEWNDTAAAVEPLCLHRRIEAQVERTPEAAALVFEGARLSYREMNRRANRLAASLRGLGVGPDTPVALCAERSFEMVIGLLAILKAGGAYVPLDPSYPRERLAFMLEDALADAAAPVLLVQPHLAKLLPDAPRSGVLVLGIDAGAPDEADDCNLPGGAGPDDAVYVIYTSGSTGRPKGVVNTHRAVCNRLLWFQGVCPIGADDRVLQKTPFSFDVSVWELFWPLLTGARLVLARPEGHRDGDYLAGLIAAQGVTTAHFVPSMLQVFLEAPDLDRCRPLRRVVTSGEALPGDLRDRFFSRLQPHTAGAGLYNLYGPTEAAVEVTYHACRPEEDGAAVPIGRPIANVGVFILDAERRPVPVGVAGELLIGGVALARGYLRRPDLTGEKFVPHPSAVRPGERLYRTGDLARHLPSGEVEYLGRIDHQVKIRGFRVELGEIEAVLARHPAVREAVVLLQKDSLAACLVFQGEEATRGELRAFLQERLPEHMVPSLFVPLAELPLMPNGKADRRALAALAEAGPEAEEAGPSPGSPLEEVVAGIWAEVLGRERVPLQESFFELGGHSLLAIRVVSRVRSVLGTEVPLRTLFERPTVASFAGAVAESRAGAARTAPPVTRVRGDGPMPLSFAQQRLWFLDRLEPGSAAYNLPVALRIEGPLDVAALAAALREVARRHEVLRTTFRTVAGAPVYEVGPETAASLSVVDLTALPAEGLRRETSRQAAAEAQRPFDLSRDPMLRTTLLATGRDRYAILLTQHHIASDGWSLGVLLRELGALYGAFSQGLPSPLPELEVQYADFAAWQRSWLSGEVLEEEISYWKARLAGAPQLLELPADRPRPAVQTFRGASRGFALTPELSRALDALSRRQGATLFMTLLAAFQTLLARLSGRGDVSVGTPVAGRTQVQTEDLIGFFVNTLVLRTDLGGDPSFAALLARVRETTLDAFAHQDLPFEKLVEEVRPERSLSHSPLFQQMFILQNTPSGGAGLPGLKLSALGGDNQTAKFDLTLSMTEAAGRLAGALNYNTDLFDRTTAERWLGHFERLLEAAVRSPEARLSDLPLLAEAERHQLLVEWSDTAVPADPDAGLHRLFEAQAARTPDAVAVVFEDRQWTYAGLDRQANRLAHRLARLDVGREDRVGILIERSPEMVTGLLAVLKAGAAYVPLDPAYPVERLELMAGDAGIKALLTQDALAGVLSCPGARVLRWDADAAEVAGESPEPPRRAAGPHDLAYVIYTSGSTGRPKGVQIPHGAIVNFLRSMAERPGLAAADVLLSVTTLSFDIAGLELFLPLARGARVVLAGRATAADGAALARLLAESGASVMQATPAPWQLLLNAGWAGAPWLKVLCGGEALPRDLALRLLQAAGEVWNVYGPTETTVWSAVQLVEATAQGIIPLGRPIANTQLRILGSRQEVVPAGVPGELHIGGLGLARGYFGRPDLTAERFVPDPFTVEPGARLYRTGDLTRYLPDGTVEFLGRIDHQVKVRGFRIELGEVEAVLAGHAAVREAVCVVREDLPGGRGLAAYVVPDREAPPADKLRGLLAEKLPAYMVPAHLVFLEALPLTANGKVDRRALPAPDRAADRAEGPVAPRNRLELELLRIWEEVLDVRPIGVRDDFFRLGGHSLLAVLLMARIEERFGQALPLATLFRNGTVEGLAAVLESRSPALARSPLVALQPAGELPPFFCVHPAEGGVLCYRPLAERLGSDRPFYGLQAKGTESDREEPHTRIDDMAREYVAAVRAVQPEGPYHLGGWSFGALVAFEMARQLRAAGQEVAVLALLDLAAPGSLPFRAPDEAVLLASLAGQAGLDMEADELAGLAHDERVAHVAARAEQAGLLPADAGIGYIERKLAFLRAVDRSIRTYEPGPYAGTITLLRSSEPSNGELARLAAADPGLGWSRYSSEPLSIHFAPGNHQTMIQEPHVAAAAGVLRSTLG